jgi:hypothetical protein
MLVLPLARVHAHLYSLTGRSAVVRKPKDDVR